MHLECTIASHVEGQASPPGPLSNIWRGGVDSRFRGNDGLRKGLHVERGSGLRPRIGVTGRACAGVRPGRPPGTPLWFGADLP